VAQSFLNNFGMHTTFEHKAGVGMPGIVEPNSDTCFDCQFTPGVANRIRAVGCAVIMAEYEVII